MQLVSRKISEHAGSRRYAGISISNVGRGATFSDVIHIISHVTARPFTPTGPKNNRKQKSSCAWPGFTGEGAPVTLVTRLRGQCGSLEVTRYEKRKADLQKTPNKDGVIRVCGTKKWGGNKKMIDASY